VDRGRRANLQGVHAEEEVFPWDQHTGRQVSNRALKRRIYQGINIEEGRFAEIVLRIDAEKDFRSFMYKIFQNRISEEFFP
jgi:hypothetical protein